MQYGNGLCHNGVSVNGLRGSKNGHTSVKHEEGPGPATEGSGARVACLSAQNFLV